MLSPGRLKIGIAGLAILLFAAGVVVFQPRWFMATLAKWSPDVVFFVKTEKQAVALTVDDGPDAVVTPKLLDLLGQHGAHATFFFITGRLPGNEEIILRTVQEGHELANHTTTDEPSILLKRSEFERRFLQAHQELSRFSDVRWFRPGSGWYSKKMLSFIRRHGYRCALGSVYPFDPQIPSSWFIKRHVLRGVQPGSIIVLHDWGARGERTIAALVSILPELKRRGFRVVTLSELWRLEGDRARRNFRHGEEN
jgi:peptidoglycan/xylan/chitin deacetylase (PgdA/CDA1 family)